MALRVGEASRFTTVVVARGNGLLVLERVRKVTLGGPWDATAADPGRQASSALIARSAPRAAVSSPSRTRRTSQTFHRSGMLWRAADSSAASR